MDLKPLSDHLIVKPLEPKEVTKGGIILPDTSEKEKPTDGEVLAVGPGKLADGGQRVALEVKKGDRIIFSKYAGTELKIDGQKYLIIREEDVLAVH